jgi:hypothetical protein
VLNETCQIQLTCERIPRSNQPGEWSVDVFISYTQDDRESAEELARYLEQHGISVWRDAQSIQPGESITRAIREAIQAAPNYIALVSSSTESSRWFNLELASAVAAAATKPKRLIPVRLTPSAKIPPYLRHLKWIDLANKEDRQRQLEALVTAIRQPPQSASLGLTEDLAAAQNSLALSQHGLRTYSLEVGRGERVLSRLAVWAVVVSFLGLFASLISMLLSQSPVWLSGVMGILGGAMGSAISLHVLRKAVAAERTRVFTGHE